MILLLDNTVLSNFASVERMDLLYRVVGRGAVPLQVFQELQQGIKKGLLPPVDVSRLQVLEPTPEEEVDYNRLRQKLNRGEAACLAIAAHRKARVLTDDRDARILAGRMGIPVSGTLGVLVQLVRSGSSTLDEADRLLEAMIRQGYWAPISKLQDLL